METAIQEHHILAHELAHLVLWEDPKQVEGALTQMLSYLEHSASFGREQYANRGLPYPYAISDSDTMRLAQELICDRLATDFVVSYFKEEGISPVQTVEAIWLGQLHLWWFDVLRIAADCFAEGRSPDRTTVPNVAIRVRQSTTKFNAHGLLTLFGISCSREEIRTRFQQLEEKLFRTWLQVSDSLGDHLGELNGESVDALNESLERELVQNMDLASRVKEASARSATVTGMTL